MWISPARLDIAYIGLDEDPDSRTRRRANASSGMQTPSPPDWPIWVSPARSDIAYIGLDEEPDSLARRHTKAERQAFGAMITTPKSFTRNPHPWDRCAGNFARGEVRGNLLFFWN
jgi:hypothetical protein